MTRLAALSLACAIAACGTDDSPASGMRVSVFKNVPQMGCLAQLESDPLAMPASELMLTLCGPTADLQLVAGVDQLTLVIDYGALAFAESTEVPPPTVTAFSDGVPITTTTAPSPNLGHRHALFEITFIVPARPGTQLSIAAQAATGFSRTLPNHYPLVAPEPAIEIEECRGVPACSLIAAVGTIAVHVTVGGATPQMVTLVSIVDGVSQPGAVAVDVNQPNAGSRVEGVVFPLVPQGARWSLRAVLGAASAATPEIELRAPAISATLACATTCAAGMQTALVVTAPRRIHPATASANVVVGGVPLISGGAVPLTVENVAANTISGTLPITFPATRGQSVVIDSLVAGYPATTINITLQ